MTVICDDLNALKHSPRIMVVDGNSFTRRMVCDLLLQIGACNIIVSRSGSHVEKAVSGRPLEAIVTAADCGDMSGVDLARRLRFGAFSISPETPVVLIAPDLCQRQLQEIIVAGVDEILVQPLSLNALRLRLWQMMFRRRQFIDSRHYVGPCRRRRAADGYSGPCRRLCDDLSAEVSGGGEISYLARIYSVLSGLIAAEWRIDGAELTAMDFYKLLTSHAADVGKSGSRELSRIWTSATNYLQGTGASATRRDLDILREHMQISYIIARTPNASHDAISGRIDDLEQRSKGMLHSHQS